MKKYIKCTIWSILSALFLTQASFAAIFNEPRRILLPKYSNAVYGNLSVRDTMFLNMRLPEGMSDDGNAYFLMEIGQRPRYFWDPDRRYSVFMNQTLSLNSSRYVDNEGKDLDANNLFSIFRARVLEGVFIGTGLIFNYDSTVQMQGNDTKLFMNLRNSFKASLVLAGDVNHFTVYSYNLNFFYGMTPINDVLIENMLLRDYAYKISDNKVIPFPSPRLMIYQENNKYRAAGFSTKFNLKELPETTIKSYYGPWTIVSANNVSTVATCPTTDRCEKVMYTTTQQAVNPKSGPRWEHSYDDENTEFECVGKVLPETPQLEKWYDPDVPQCFDYQLIQMPQIKQGGNTKPAVYDSNGAVYEFKVQEILQMDPNNTLINILKSQKPEFRLFIDKGGNIKTVAISKSRTGTNNWNINPEYSTVYNGVYVGGDDVAVDSLPVKVPDDIPYNDVCYMLCGGKVCTSNKVFVRETRDGGEELTRTESPQSVPLTPQSPYSPPVINNSGSTYIFTYTVGICLSNSKTLYTSTDYEINYEPSHMEELMTGLAVETGTDEYQAPKACVKRVVKCNKISGESSLSKRSYKLLTAE